MDPSRPAAELIELVALVVRSLSGHRDVGLTALSTLSSLELHGPQRIAALTAAEGTTQPAMTQMIQRLEQRELVTVARGADPDDARAVVATITRKGRAALEAQRRRSRERVGGLLSDLPEADVQALADALAAVLPALRERLESDRR